MAIQDKKIAFIVSEIEKEIDCKLHDNVKFIKSDGNLTVEVSADGITVTYSKLFQIARALLLLKTHGTDTFYKISSPDNFDNIGFMADCSRNAVPTVDMQKKLIRHLAMLGYNEVMLYMEDTYEVDNQPMFGYLRGRYTKQELKEIDDYACKFGMDVVPCIQTLAHLMQIRRWGQYAGLMDIDDILLCDDERVYKLIDDMLSTLSQCITCKKIHLGMDEAHKLGKGQYLNKHGLVDPMVIITKHINRVVEICNKYNLQPMIWADMFFRLLNKGEYYLNNGSGIDFGKETLQQIPNSLGLVYWDYYSTDTSHYDNMLKAYKQFNNNIRYANMAWRVGNASNNLYSLKTIDAVAPALFKHGVRDVMICGWADDGSETALFAVLPAIVYFALKINGFDKSEAEKEFQVLTGMSLDDYMQLDEVNNTFSTNQDKKPTSLCKNFLYNDLFLGYLDKLVDPAQKQNFQQIIDKLQKGVGTKYSYVFECNIALAKVLSIKLDLGIRCRTCYYNKDTDGLKQIIADLDQLIVYVQEYYDKMHAQWYAENKPQGFEVLDIRLGGLKCRLQNCRSALQQFVDKKINAIPELDEKLCDEAFGNTKASDFCVNQWNVNCTANVL